MPGFHGFARTALVGLAGPGSAILDVFCACSEEPVAQVTVRTRDPRPDEFRVTELGGGKIALTPALDLLSGHGHFSTEAVWRTDPDGWQRIGAIDSKKIAAIRKALRPARAKAATTSGIATKCGCGHDMGFHDPCSKCECPKFHPIGKTEKFKARK